MLAAKIYVFYVGGGMQTFKVPYPVGKRDNSHLNK